MEQKVGGLKRKVRNRMRSVTKKVIAIGLALRHKGTEGELKRQTRVSAAAAVDPADSQRFTAACCKKSKHCQHPVAGVCADWANSWKLWPIKCGGWVRQTKARVFAGLTQFPDKLVSVFEPHTENHTQREVGKPNEFGKLVALQEAENQIITHYEVYEERQRPAPAASRRGSASPQLGRVPRWVAADAGFYSRAMKKGLRPWA